MRYAAHRFRNTTNMGVTIDKQISAIISTFNTRFNTGFPIDRKNYHLLRRIIKSIKKKPGRVDHGRTIPIDNKLLTKMVDLCNDTYNGIVLSTMFVFAKSFALRSGDYTISPKNDTTLTWGNINLGIYNKLKFVTLSTTNGKHNQFNKPEIVTQACACNIFTSKVCIACLFFKYKQVYNNKFGLSPKAPLFRWEDGATVTYSQFSKFFKLVLVEAGETPSKYLKPHGFRFGGITDLRRHKVEDWLIRKTAKHSPQSHLTWYYTVLSSEEEAFRIRNAMLRNKPHDTQDINNSSNPN